MQYLTQFLVGLVSIVLLDTLRIGFVAKSLYKNWLGAMMKESPELVPGMLTRVTIVIGILIFVVYNPAVSSWKSAALYGSLFGAISYAIYELTNRAIIKNRQPAMVVVDILWGTLLCGLVAAVIYAVK